MSPDSERSRSIWTSARMPLSKPLSAHLKTEILVIGAGITGLSTAYELAGKGHDVVVVDRGRIGRGMTARTSAHLSWEIDDFYFEVVDAHGASVAKRYFESQKAALDRIEAICTEERISCDFARVDLFYLASDRHGRAALKKEQRALRELGIAELDIADAPIEKSARDALRFPNQARFHPLRYLGGLARALVRRGVPIYSDTPIVEITESPRNVRAVAENGLIITAKVAVTATNTSLVNRVAVHEKQAPYRSYVIAARIKKGSAPDILLWDTACPYHYMRIQPGERHDFLIVGGEDHKTGEADDALARRDRLYAWTRERFRGVGPIEYFWSGQIFEPVDYLPFVGRSPNHKRIYFVSGDSGEGLTTGVAASLILPDLIAGKNHPWARAYGPNRKTSKPSVAATYVRDFVGAMKHVVEHAIPDLKTAEDLKPGQAAVVTENKKKIAAYRDDRGNLHRQQASCTHAGCVVQWNSFERCWDCPCHGSQFAPTGQVLNGPALHALRPAEE